jgi:hypothetical protein
MRKKQKQKQMQKKKEDTKKQATPVMKQLARPMSKDEQAKVGGAVTNPAFSEHLYPRGIDYLN